MQWWASASMITFRCWYHFRATKYLLVVLSRFIRNPIDKLFCVDLFTAISDQDIGRVIEHIWALFFRSLTVFRNTAHRYLVELVTVLPIRIVIWVLVSDTALRLSVRAWVRLVAAIRLALPIRWKVLLISVLHQQRFMFLKTNVIELVLLVGLILVHECDSAVRCDHIQLDLMAWRVFLWLTSEWLLVRISPLWLGQCLKTTFDNQSRFIRLHIEHLEMSNLSIISVIRLIFFIGLSLCRL
jgi:hypothetical protein